MSGIGPELLAKLLDERGPALELYARQWCDTPADVVQEAFVRLIRQPQPPANLIAWLYRTVRNGAISAARSADRRRRHERQAAALGTDWFTSERAGEIDAESLGQSLAALPLDEREVVVAHLWGRLTFEQIAVLAGISSSTAHRRYQAGLKSLRESLGAPCIHPPRTTTN